MQLVYRNCIIQDRSYVMVDMTARGDLSSHAKHTATKASHAHDRLQPTHGRANVGGGSSSSGTVATDLVVNGQQVVPPRISEARR